MKEGLFYFTISQIQTWDSWVGGANTTSVLSFTLKIKKLRVSPENELLEANDELEPRRNQLAQGVSVRWLKWSFSSQRTQTF